MEHTTPKNKVIVLTGGGTAGHVTPHLALLPGLLKEGFQVHYLGTPNGIERGMMEGREGVSYHPVASGKLRRYFSWRNFTDPFRVIQGFFQAYSILGQLKPEVLFSKGGFVAVPVVVAAWLRGIPALAHESDLTPGLANRISAFFVDKVATTFPECARAIGKKAVYTGTPMRRELLHGLRQRGLEAAGFDGSKPVLLVMGGSQGAQAINQALRAALPRALPRMDVLHLCGKGKLDDSLQGTRGYYQAEFVSEDLPHILAATDVVLSRAGATAIGEFLAKKLPMLLVPLTKGASRGDQIINAENFKNRGFARVLPQEDMTPDTLAQALFDLLDNADSLRDNMLREPDADGTGRVLALIKELADKKR